jgi:hypothetical protein
LLLLLDSSSSSSSLSLSLVVDGGVIVNFYHCIIYFILIFQIIPTQADGRAFTFLHSPF